MVAYQLEKKGMSLVELFENPPGREAVERELASLTAW